MTDTPWRVEFERRARKDLDRLDPPTQRRVLKAILGLAADPHGARGLRKLTARRESRLRVGDWRVLLELSQGNRIITVVRVLPRGRAYER